MSWFVSPRELIRGLIYHALLGLWPWALMVVLAIAGAALLRKFGG